LRNAYNEIKRAVVFRRLEASPHLRCLVPLFHATYCTQRVVYLARDGLEAAPFVSDEGVQQGDGLASTAFCAGIHPEVKALDQELAEFGGAARFDMDDGYAVGPPGVVFPAVQRFGAAVRFLGLDLQESKCECFSPAGPSALDGHRPDHFPLGQLVSDTVVGFGIPVGGVPVGDDVFVRQFLCRKARKAMSKIEVVTEKLRPLHLQALHCAKFFSFTATLLM